MDLSDPIVTKQGQNLHVHHGDDRNLFVTFSLETIEDAERSREEGRPIFKEVEMITIRIVGDNKTVVVRPIDYVGNGQYPPDPERFPRQYNAFKNQQAQPLEGTPITEWPPVSKALALELKGINIHTVEALAACSDSNLTWMGARALRDKAVVWLDQAKDGAGAMKLQAENEDLRNQLKAMQNQIDALSKAATKKATNGKDVS